MTPTASRNWASLCSCDTILRHFTSEAVWERCGHECGGIALQLQHHFVWHSRQCGGGLSVSFGASLSTCAAPEAVRDKCEDQCGDTKPPHMTQRRCRPLQLVRPLDLTITHPLPPSSPDSLHPCRGASNSLAVGRGCNANGHVQIQIFKHRF